MVDLEQLDLRMQDIEMRLNGIQFQLFRIANSLEYKNGKDYGYKPDYQQRKNTEL